jgi:hypothetical protein
VEQAAKGHQAVQVFLQVLAQFPEQAVAVQLPLVRLQQFLLLVMAAVVLLIVIQAHQ